ncbi:putative serine/threonine-protein kinase PRKY isoform X1 [Lampetra fluviatilis]
MAETVVDKTGGAGETDENVAGGTTSEQRADSPGASEDAAYSLEQIEMLTVVGTGTFGRVLLVRHRRSAAFYALKVMSIADVLRLKQERHVQSEKDILRDVQPHPFIIQLFWTHHDERFLYMLMEFVSGGELFSYLRTDGRFAASRAVFFAAEITCALAYLHSRAVVYRDLKPENVLLDRDGHVKLTDFGFAKILQDRTWTMCGTPEYLAPEIIQSKGYGKGVDWWALGVLIFEMLCGDLIKKLLASDRTRRLGNMKVRYAAASQSQHRCVCVCPCTRGIRVEWSGRVVALNALCYQPPAARVQFPLAANANRQPPVMII